MKKRMFKFAILIGAIAFALSVDIVAQITDDRECPDEDGGGAGITCGKYEGACWELDWISPIIYIHCRFTGYQDDYCVPDV